MLKPGGTFLICNEADGLHAADEKWTQKIPGMTIYTAVQLHALLQAVGFAEITADNDAKKHWLCVTAKKAK